MTDIDLPAWLTLYFANKLNNQTVLQLLRTYKSPAKILNASQDDLKSKGLSLETIQSLHSPNLVAIHKTQQWVNNANCHLLSFDHPKYPPLLKTIHSPPIILFAQGNLQSLNQPQIAIVGSRNPTPSGRNIAEQFAFQLSQIGFHITSGLAIGIDAHAHRGALQQEGGTIAVLGSGLLQLYPRRNASLAHEITKKGLLLSEFPLNASPRRHHFPRRNRLISGLSLGTLVVEATIKSGSLITAHFAADQGREVFAIPSAIDNPLAKGCHALIQNGAKLTETVHDIIEELTPQYKNVHLGSNKLVDGHQNPDQDKLAQQKLDVCGQTLLDCFGFETISVDQLVERSGFSVSAVSATLFDLELKGIVTQTAGGYIRAK